MVKGCQFTIFLRVFKWHPDWKVLVYVYIYIIYIWYKCVIFLFPPKNLIKPQNLVRVCVCVLPANLLIAIGGGIHGKWLSKFLKGIVWEVLLMEEILHHLGCIKPCEWWGKLPTSTGAGFPPPTVCKFDRKRWLDSWSDFWMRTVEIFGFTPKTTSNYVHGAQP